MFFMKRQEDIQEFVLRLPQGYQVVNKKPVLKEITARRSGRPEQAWTCWVKSPSKETFLAVLKQDPAGAGIKLIPEQKLQLEYQIKSIKI